MTVFLKVAVVELVIRGDCYCGTEHIYTHTSMMHSVILKTPKIVCECVLAGCYVAPSYSVSCLLVEWLVRLEVN